MMEVLESIDKLMKQLPEKYYSRLLGNLAWIIYALENESESNCGLFLTKILDCPEYPEEEREILRYFIKNENVRPTVLASVYVSTIISNFQVNYSV